MIGLIGLNKCLSEALLGLTQRVFLVSRKGAEEQRFLFLLYEKGAESF